MSWYQQTRRNEREDAAAMTAQTNAKARDVFEQKKQHILDMSRMDQTKGFDIAMSSISETSNMLAMELLMQGIAPIANNIKNSVTSKTRSTLDSLKGSLAERLPESMVGLRGRLMNRPGTLPTSRSDMKRWLTSANEVETRLNSLRKKRVIRKPTPIDESGNLLNEPVTAANVQDIIDNRVKQELSRKLPMQATSEMADMNLGLGGLDPASAATPSMARNKTGKARGTPQSETAAPAPPPPQTELRSFNFGGLSINTDAADIAETSFGLDRTSLPDTSSAAPLQRKVTRKPRTAQVTKPKVPEEAAAPAPSAAPTADATPAPTQRAPPPPSETAAPTAAPESTPESGPGKRDMHGVPLSELQAKVKGKAAPAAPSSSSAGGDMQTEPDPVPETAPPAPSKQKKKKNTRDTRRPTQATDIAGEDFAIPIPKRDPTKPLTDVELARQYAANAPAPPPAPEDSSSGPPPPGPDPQLDRDALPNVDTRYRKPERVEPVQRPAALSDFEAASERGYAKRSKVKLSENLKKQYMIDKDTALATLRQGFNKDLPMIEGRIPNQTAVPDGRWSGSSADFRSTKWDTLNEHETAEVLRNKFGVGRIGNVSYPLSADKEGESPDEIMQRMGVMSDDMLRGASQVVRDRETVHSFRRTVKALNDKARQGHRAIDEYYNERHNEMLPKTNNLRKSVGTLKAEELMKQVPQQESSSSAGRRQADVNPAASSYDASSRRFAMAEGEGMMTDDLPTEANEKALASARPAAPAQASAGPQGMETAKDRPRQKSVVTRTGEDVEEDIGPPTRAKRAKGEDVQGPPPQSQAQPAPSPRPPPQQERPAPQQVAGDASELMYEEDDAPDLEQFARFKDMQTSDVIHSYASQKGRKIEGSISKKLKAVMDRNLGPNERIAEGHEDALSEAVPHLQDTRFNPNSRFGDLPAEQKDMLTTFIDGSNVPANIMPVGTDEESSRAFHGEAADAMNLDPIGRNIFHHSVATRQRQEMAGSSEDAMDEDSAELPGLSFLHEVSDKVKSRTGEDYRGRIKQLEDLFNQVSTHPAFKDSQGNFNRDLDIHNVPLDENLHGLFEPGKYKGSKTVLQDTNSTTLNLPMAVNEMVGDLHPSLKAHTIQNIGERLARRNMATDDQLPQSAAETVPTIRRTRLREAAMQANPDMAGSESANAEGHAFVQNQTVQNLVDSTGFTHSGNFNGDTNSQVAQEIHQTNLQYQQEESNLAKGDTSGWSNFKSGMEESVGGGAVAGAMAAEAVVPGFLAGGILAAAVGGLTAEFKGVHEKREIRREERAETAARVQEVAQEKANAERVGTQVASAADTSGQVQNN